MSDIFSFRIIRGPQRQANAEGIALYPLRPPKSKWQSKSSTTLLDRLVDAGPAASRQAQIFIDGKSFIDRRRELPVPLRDIDIWLMKRGNRTGPASVSKFASKVGSSPVPVLIASRSWYETRRALADSLVAAMVARHREPEVFVYLHRQIIVAGLVETLARTPSILSSADDVADYLRSAYVLLPIRILDLTPTKARLARRFGFSELTVVRDDWSEYRFGEIAHVENALAGEIRERTHQRITESETTETRQEERETEEVSDVEKTDRFEMSSSSSQDVTLKAHAEATLDISAEYPSTTVDVHVGGSFDYSQEQSREQATKMAQETIARSVKRVEDKVSVVRASRKLERFEESNLHRFENAGTGAKTIVAIYRWIDKIQRLQAFHYPHRFLLELQVPEPSAFVHWRRKRPPTDFINPPPPEFVKLAPDGEPLVEYGLTSALAPTDITPETYLHYARRYRLGDIEQPPPPMVIKSIPIVLGATPGGGDGLTPDEESVADRTQYDLVGGGDGQSADGATAGTGVQLDEGYRLGAWSISIQTYTSKYTLADTTGGTDVVVTSRDHHPLFKVAVGQVVQNANSVTDHETPVVPDGAYASHNVYNTAYTASSVLSPGQPPVTGQVPVTIWARHAREFRAHLGLVCYRMPEGLLAWQLRVYQRLAAEFRAQEVRYFEERAARAIGSGVQISGDSPERNKEVMREELKRSAIRLLSDGTYPPSNLPLPSSDPDIGPVFDLDSAALTAPEIQFIEQAFEWENMTFVLYPYFWGGQGKWRDRADIPDDSDAQFARFLRSGSARVVVPARPGFEGQVRMYVDSGVLWGGGPVPAVDDEEYLSVAEEIRMQTGAANKGEPGEWWDVRLPTSLVAVDLGALLPLSNPAPAVGPAAPPP